ncbi:MAG: NAD(P)(+) transhydrogenase (Re/Si-specific) subunit beta, partial [Terrimicrobiaceae bacterium]|nr:NAD(P)(+) transhydrogenase (Re/Si-specific) subunit beta [Terrimicrobiaceae bacterium]
MSAGSGIIDLGYIIASVLFIFGLKLLSAQRTARLGNLVSAVGMLVAVVLTLLQSGLEYQWIAVGLVAGSLVGAILALRVQMTAMPEMVALFNGFGGLASLLVAWAEYDFKPSMPAAFAAPAILAVLIGGVTFTGSLIAFGKLSETISGKPVLFRGQALLNALLLLAALGAGTAFT